MRRFISASLIVSSFLTPALAFAAFTMPSDLLLAMKKDTSPRSFSMEAHAHMKEEQDVWVAIWANGVQQGGPEIETVKTSIKMTVDIAFPSENMKVRMKGEMRAIDGIFYMKIDSAEGNYENDITKVSLNAAMKKWIKVPLDELEDDQLTSLMDDDQAMLLTNEIFDLVSKPYASGTIYHLNFKREILREWLRSMNGKVEFKNDFTIDVSSADLFKSMKMNISFNSAEADGSMILNAQKASSISVQAPADAQTIEEIFAETPLLDNPFSTFGHDLNGSDIEDNWNMADPGMSEWEEIEWEEWETVDPNPTPVRRVNERPSARQIREAAENRE